MQEAHTRAGSPGSSVQGSRSLHTCEPSRLRTLPHHTQKRFSAALLSTFKQAATITSPADTRVPAQTSRSASLTFPHTAEALAFLQPPPNSHLAFCLVQKMTLTTEATMHGALIAT